ncbi:MAG: aminoglycoside phosphotransferase family protein [Smithellaceae bacterium]|jgi:aminoglycoside/choline kinase family phosphotransferase
MEFAEGKIKKFLSDNLGSRTTFEILPIKKGGSDRSFFRVSLPDKTSFIFMHYGTNIEENAYWIGIDKFLSSINIFVPRIIVQDLRQHFILMEDLGDIDLWQQRTLPWHTRRDYYYRVLTQIRRLHSFKLKKIPTNLKLSPRYGPKLYRWEHNYFLENLVGEVCKIKTPSSLLKELKKELESLSTRLQKIKPCLIHRDFQSQNIMIKDDRPVLIDFQGMRRGNLFYDLGSLICDPYVSFTTEERNELINFYYKLKSPDYSRNDFAIYFWEASAQRLMQALGAYGFLGLKKHKPDFLKHIYNGIRNLILSTSNAKNLPLLHELSQQCESILADR